jgi:Arc/MetJ-type ribon-helix-helix transcriptional regulator
MKLSVSIRAEDVEFLDSYASVHAISSRSAVVQEAIRALRREGLPDAYSRAWDEWRSGGDAEPWDHVVGDGL